MNHLKYIKTVLLISILLVACKSYAQHAFVQEDIVKVPGINTLEQLYGLPIGDRNTTRMYIDGLGRPLQRVDVKASPQQKDIIQFSTYDALGRSSRSYLPYAAVNTTGTFRSNANTEQAVFYSTVGEKHATDAQPYSEQVFDNSPLQRILRAGSVGSGYQPTEHYKSYAERTNTTGEVVRRWNVDGSAAADYAAGSLQVSIGNDGEGGETIIYTDNTGHTVLKKEYLNEGGVGYLETYYVYSDAGQLLFVVPPKALQEMVNAGNFSLGQAVVQKLIFSYVYDSDGKLIERTVPGSGAVYMVYDPLDRLVLAQDANLRNSNKWNYIKYDSRGHAVSQGIYTDAVHTNRSSMQSYVSGLNYNTSYFEERNNNSATGYYTNTIFPSVTIEPLAYSYYDDYDMDGNGSADFSYAAQGLTDEGNATGLIRGMPTIVSKRTIGNGTPVWLYSVMFYDKRGNVIQVQGNNQLTTAVNSHQTTVPNFIGQTIRTKSVQVAGSQTTTVYSEMMYDHMGRTLAVDEKYNSGSFIRVAAYTYNELGQLVDRKLHSTNGGSTYLQSVDYRYTIRGQLASINNSTLGVDDSNDDTNDVFGMNLLYETSDGGIGNTGRYNGLISAVKWKTNAPGVAATANERSYRFVYDRLMRLNDAVYADRSSGSSWGNIGAYDEKSISYDLNGNLNTLQRRAVLSGTATDVDNLSYSYDGNRLSNVADGAGGSFGLFGFKNLTGSGTGYEYDLNGNMTADPKKGINLDYNVLNRTNRITITTATGRYIDYSYTADGVLLNKKAYDNHVLQKSTDYIGGFVYENGTLMHFAMAEGRVRNAGGTLINEYFIKDNQGNVRVSFEDNGGVALVRQENSYYPFGLSMPGSTIPSAANRNLYNGGSEWQDDFADLPDLQQTFYRNYDPALGRFVAVDPMAEASESLGTYHYALNNPLMFNDPLGDQADYSAFWNQALSYTTKNGASFNHSQGWNEYDSSLEGFYAGAENMNKHGMYGLYEGWANNYLEAASLFNNIGDGGAATNVDVSGYLTTAVVRVDRNGNGVEINGHAAYATTFFVGEGKNNYLSENTNSGGSSVNWVDGLQMALDGIGMTEIPVLSQGAELISAGISLGKGDYTGAAIGLGSMIPVGGKVFEGMKVARAAAKIGQEAHSVLKAKALAKGWGAEVTMLGKNGRKYRPDVITPSGNFIELKPNTISGRLKGWYQSNTYKRQLGIHGRVVYYNP